MDALRPLTTCVWRTKVRKLAHLLIHCHLRTCVLLPFFFRIVGCKLQSTVVNRFILLLKLVMHEGDIDYYTYQINHIHTRGGLTSKLIQINYGKPSNKTMNVGIPSFEFSSVNHFRSGKCRCANIRDENCLRNVCCGIPVPDDLDTYTYIIHLYT